MIFSSPIRQAFEQVFGQALRYPGDFTALSEDVSGKGNSDFEKDPRSVDAATLAVGAQVHHNQISSKN